MITAQASGHESLHVVDTSELYAEDVQLISKNGKIYYLPEKKTTNKNNPLNHHGWEGFVRL